ncbi:hypothetical protein VmeM32_00182 [Vibrio phage vB_VmeM-32]|nr:hypothetical protein VmeM32_00182 [Vibrio phage vB_VmeM-32]
MKIVYLKQLAIELDLIDQKRFGEYDIYSSNYIFVIANEKISFNEFILTISEFEDHFVNIFVGSNYSKIMNYFYNNINTESSECDMMNHINHGDYRVRMALASLGTHAVRECLISDDNYLVRMSVAIYGNDEQRTLLINDVSSYVREQIAIHGNLKHCQLLANDESSRVTAVIDERFKNSKLPKCDIDYYIEHYNEVGTHTDSDIKQIPNNIIPNNDCHNNKNIVERIYDKVFNKCKKKFI